MTNRFPLLCALSAFLFYSCGSSKKATVSQYKTLDTITVSAANNPLDIYRASRPRTWDIEHTRVALSFDLKNRTAAGREWVRLRPYMYATDTLVLDAKSMDIDSVGTHSNGNIQPVRFAYADDKLKVYFGRQYKNNETVELYIKYTAKPYSEPTGGSAAITDDRGLYFINSNNEIPNKPVQIWTQGETESNSHWLPTIDQPNERTTAQIELTVPDDFKTLGNGVLKSSQPTGNGLRTDIWAIDKPIQVYAIMFAIGKFSIVKDESWKDVGVEYYVEPEFEPYAKKMFKNTPEMVGYFSGITGVPYPWNKYSQVVVRDYVSGAMENTTASLFGEFMNQNNREIADKNYEDIVSHELFHQWFGDYVTAESWSNLTVNESFANYGEQLWRKYKYGDASNDELAYNDLAKYLSQTDYNDETLVRFYYGDKEEMFDRISYEKGGAILNYLNGLVGDEAFYKAMNIYLTKNALQPAEAHNWRMAVEEATGLDWNWFFNQWYYRPGHPELSIDYDYDNKKNQLVVNVKQVAADSGRAYNLPMKAALIYGDEKQIIDWTVNSKKQSFTYPYKNGIKPLFVPDQEHWLVGVIRENKTPSLWLQQLQHSNDYINKRKALGGAFSKQADSATRRAFHLGLKDPIDGIRLYTLNLMERMQDKSGWYKDFKEDVAFMAINDGANRVRGAAFDVLGKWKVSGYQQEMQNAISDSSYLVAGAALEALNKSSKDTGYILAKQVLDQQPKASLETAAWSIVAQKGNGSDVNFFEDRAPYVYGSRKISFAMYLNMFMSNTTDDNAYKKGLDILLQLTRNESIKGYRIAIGSIIFQSNRYYKEQQKMASTPEKIEAFRNRQSLAERYQETVMKEEKDPDNIKKYKNL